MAVKAKQINLTPKQAYMINDLANVDEVLWGGQAGGGKSEGLIMFALIRRLTKPKSVGLLMRRTFPDLEKSLIRKSFDYYQQYAKYNEAKKRWHFFNGSIEEFGFCERDKDVYQYQSAEYDDICPDELTHFSEFQYLYMMSRLRSRVGLKTLMRAGTNPGNIGHMWVKGRFVDVAREKIYRERIEIGGEVHEKTRYFLPANLHDNTLMPAQQRLEYELWLSQLPEAEREMLMNGNWDYVPGAAFGELNRKTHAYNPYDHPVPRWAKIFMSYDFGFGKPFSVGWYWVDYDGRVWRFNEWYGWNGQSDQGLRMAISEVAKGILKREEQMGLKERINYRVAGPDIFSKTPNVRGGGQGPSVAEIMSEHGVIFQPGDPDRLLGKQQCHERFRVSDKYDEKKPETWPMAMISDKCIHFWRTVPVLVVDENNIEDVDTDQEDHVYDEFKIACMSRPISPQHQKPVDNHIQKIIKKVQTAVSVDDMAEIYEY